MNHKMLNPRCAKCINVAGWVSVAGNVLLAVIKWTAGFYGNSQALLADALHSTVDVLGSVITLVMLKLSRRKASDRYPYGLGKLEDIAALGVYLILVGAGMYMVVDAIHSLIDGGLATPGLTALVTAAVSIGVNLFMYYYISCAGRQAKSPSLIALGYENKVDALSSVAALLGIFGAIVGYRPLDPLAAIVVSGIIIVESLRELYHTAESLTDHALPRSVRHALERAARSAPYVQSVLAVKTRRLGPIAHADIDIVVDPDISVDAAQTIAVAVAERIRLGVDGVETVRVYAHPSRNASGSRATRLIELIETIGELHPNRQRSGSKS